MSKLWIIKYVLSSYVSMTSVLYANEYQNAVENVFRYGYTSISRIQEEKIFLKPDKIHFYEGKIYVEDIEGKGLAVPAVFSSESGLYLKSDGINIFNCWKCSNCGFLNHNWDDPTHCSNCSAPRS